MTIRTILCPIDDSEPSRQAFAHAFTVRQQYRARLIPVHVRAGVLETVPATGGGAFAMPPETKMIDATPPADAILAGAESEAADLIVMGTHGHGGVRHLILGSVAETVLHRARIPVMTVSPHVKPATGAPFTRLLAAIDFSPSSLAALDCACRLTLDAEARLDILHVADEPDEQTLFAPRPYDIHRHPEIYERHVLEHLHQVLPSSVRARLVHYVHIERGRPEDRILQFAMEHGAGLIVMGVGRGDDPTFGSTVNHIVRHASCPVLTVRRAEVRT
jgi:nucleotide-binding universal stress UspA family protein